MRYNRGKRRNRSTWFPVLGFDQSDGARPPTSWDSRPITVNSDGSPNVFALPLIPDETKDPADTTFAGDYTLRDYVEGQTCLIDRIVGKIHWLWQYDLATPPTDPWNVAICASAIAVLPVAEDTGTPEIASSMWDPLSATNLDKPWLWRRTWVIGSAYDASASSFGNHFFPPEGNWRYGSVLDGPHIDTKGVKRAVRKNERIFLIHSVQGISTMAGETVSNTNGAVLVTSDLRVLGRMMKSKNKSLFK